VTQTKPGIYPLGGNVRYEVTPDGSSIVDKRQLHKTNIEMSPSSIPKGTTPAGGYHTHVLSDVPEDTDVFFVLTRQPAVPEIIGTRNKYLQNTGNPSFSMKAESRHPPSTMCPKTCL
jgi:hypothetical protein